MNQGFSSRSWSRRNADQLEQLGKQQDEQERDEPTKAQDRHPEDDVRSRTWAWSGAGNRGSNGPRRAPPGRAGRRSTTASRAAKSAPALARAPVVGIAVPTGNEADDEPGREREQRRTRARRSRSSVKAKTIPPTASDAAERRAAADCRSHRRSSGSRDAGNGRAGRGPRPSASRMQGPHRPGLVRRSAPSSVMFVSSDRNKRLAETLATSQTMPIALVKRRCEACGGVDAGAAVPVGGGGPDRARHRRGARLPVVREPS